MYTRTGPHTARSIFRMIRRRRYEISIPADKIVEGSRLLGARTCARLGQGVRASLSAFIAKHSLETFAKVYP